MTTATITVYAKGVELELDADGYVSQGGSNAYGSDEPAWIEVEDISLACTHTGKPLSKRLTTYILNKYDEYVGMHS